MGARVIFAEPDEHQLQRGRNAAKMQRNRLERRTRLLIRAYGLVEQGTKSCERELAHDIRLEFLSR